MARKIPAPELPSGLFHARQATGFTQDKLSSLTGVPKGTISKLERTPAGGGIKLTKEWAERFAPALRVTAQELLFWPVRNPPSLNVHGVGKPQIIRPHGPELSNAEPALDASTISQLGDFDVEVRGINVGGSDDEFYFNGEVIDYIRRPPGIKRAKNVFALNVAGDSMMPRYEPGEPIYVQKTNPAVGDYVVVELFAEGEDQPGKSFLKGLVRRTSLRITCVQFNPPREVEFDAGEVRDIYRVLKTRELLG